MKAAAASFAQRVEIAYICLSFLIDHNPATRIVGSRYYGYSVFCNIDSESKATIINIWEMIFYELRRLMRNI